MKTLGILGGMSYESTLTYYQLINRGINKRLKGSHSASIYMYSFDYQELDSALQNKDWAYISNRLIEEGLKLKQVGAEGLMLCANTTHLVADQVKEKVQLPLIHIADETAKFIQTKGLKCVGLIGTRYTMESDMYPSRLSHYGIEVVLPHAKDQEIIHHIIYHELIVGQFKDNSRQQILDIIHKMNVKGIILGCTELPLLIREEDLMIHRFDTLHIHAEAAIEFMLKGDQHDL
jgi:aspartate racemase